MAEKLEEVMQALTLCAEVETTAAKIYKHFHEKLKMDDDVANFWHKIYLEEREHAAFFETQKKMLGKAPGAFGPLSLALKELAKAYTDISKIWEEARRDGLDMRRAVELAYRVELVASEGDHIRVIEAKGQSLKKVLSGILKETEKHKEEIRRLAARYGISDPEETSRKE